MTGRYRLCQTCRRPVPVAYDTAVATVLCTDCQPKDSPPKSALKCVWQPIHDRLPSRARVGVAALVVLLYVVAVGSMGMVWVLR